MCVVSPDEGPNVSTSKDLQWQTCVTAHTDTKGVSGAVANRRRRRRRYGKRSQNAKSKSGTGPLFLTISNGTKNIGVVEVAGPHRFRAIVAPARSLGIWPTLQEATDAIRRRGPQ